MTVSLAKTTPATHTTTGAPRVLSALCGPYARPSRVVGLLEYPGGSVHEMAQYPGADRTLSVPAQVVALESDGYYVTAVVTGTVTGRGYYGGPVGVVESYTLRTYAYSADEALATSEGRMAGWGQITLR